MSDKKGVRGYASGGVDAVISVEEVERRAAAIAEAITIEQLDALANGSAFVAIDNLRAGYGKMEILHDINLRVARKQSLCLIGPNGAGKSTLLHSIFGFATIFSGRIRIGDERDDAHGDSHKHLDVTSLSPNEKLSKAGIAYILQDKSIFPRYDGRGKSLDGWFSERSTGASEASNRNGFRQIPEIGRKTQASGKSPVRRRTPLA